ncbi:hypothetical protein JMJ35_000395 [Cladonia borealis]|uniref:Uncharacterized protein n=1 Tax=Cladonia borealis TaxID=184061 RepID=A0AA39R9B6_9LECA|nr:hypothetical protein JMJ35_000395 [Cladonia borealis]
MLTTQVNFTLRSSHLLLPEDGNASEVICLGDTNAGHKTSEVFIQAESVSHAPPANEVEAEERRQQNGDANLDEEEDSDDEPSISSRGWQAPRITSKKGATARKAPAGAAGGSPAPNHGNKLSHQLPNGLGSNLKNEALLRADSEDIFDGSITPPPGTITPAARLDQPLLGQPCPPPLLTSGCYGYTSTTRASRGPDLEPTEAYTPGWDSSEQDLSQPS